MKQRCSNPACSDYKYYGGRGITVCERWKESFAEFVADMGEPQEGMTLDRIDNNGPYSPENCRWATRKQQTDNSTRVKIIEAHGRRLNYSEWGRLLGVSSTAITQRIHRGMTPVDAVTIPFKRIA